MKRILSVILSLVLLLSLVPSMAFADAGNTELIYWVIGNGKQKDSDKVWEAFNEKLQEFMPGVTVNFNIVPGGEYADKWSKAMAASERIDLAWTGYTHNLENEVVMGSILQLDELVEKYGQDIVSFYGKDALDLHRLSDGKLYQIPVWQGLVAGRNGMQLPGELVDLMPEGWQEELQALVYDMQANGDDADLTKRKQVYDMMEAYLVAAKDAGKLGMGYNMSGGINGRLVGSAGTGYVNVASYGTISKGDPSYTVKNLYAEAHTKLDYEYMARWYDMGLIRSDIGSLEKVTETDWARDGMNGCITKGHNAYTDTAAEEFTMTAGFDIRVIYSNPNLNYTRGFVTGTSIPYTSEHPEEAMQLINLLMSDNGAELYQTFVYGLEGEHWTDNGDGTITTLCGSGGATSDWDYGNWNWVVGTCTHALTTQTDVKGYYDTLKALEEKAEVAPFSTFAFSNANVSTEQANIKAVVAEYTQMLTRGYLGAEGWEKVYDEFLAKLDAAGMQTYLAEVQAQVNTYAETSPYVWGK